MNGEVSMNMGEYAAQLGDGWRTLAAELRKTGVNVDFQVSYAPGVVVIPRLRVEEAERGKGRARAALARICQLADAVGVTLAITPSKAFGSTIEGLKRLYSSFGFIDNRGKHRDPAISGGMYRTPRGVE